MQTNSPRAIDSHKSSNTIVAPPAGAGNRLLTPSMEMNLSVIDCNQALICKSSLRERHEPRRARENLVEHHADEPDHQDRGDHVGD